MYSAHDIDTVIAAAGGLPPGRVEFFGSHFVRVPGGQIIERPCSRPWMVRRRLKLRWYLTMHADYASTFEPADRAHLWPRYYADVRAKCQNLLDSLAALEKNVIIARLGDSPPPLPDLEALKSAVQVVEAWAAKGAGGSGTGKISHGGARRRRKFIFEDWLQGLGEVYEDIFEKRPGFSVNPETGEVCGPFARYLHACFRPVLGGATPTPHALRAHWKRIMSAPRAKTS
jgi:hypothetical protein